MRAAQILRLTRIERRVYTAKDDRCPSGPRKSADLVAAKRIARVNP